MTTHHPKGDRCDGNDSLQLECGFCHIAVDVTHGGKRCERCGTFVPGIPGIAWNNKLCAWYALASCLLMAPAYLLPFATFQRFGDPTTTGLLLGIVQLFKYGEYFIASFILICSAVMPMVKILGLILLACGYVTDVTWCRRIYRFVEISKNWGHVEVLIASFSAFAFKLGDSVDVKLQPGLLLFWAFVVFVIHAAHHFDTRIFHPLVQKFMQRS